MTLAPGSAMRRRSPRACSLLDLPTSIGWSEAYADTEKLAVEYTRSLRRNVPRPLVNRAMRTPFASSHCWQPCAHIMRLVLILPLACGLQLETTAHTVRAASRVQRTAPVVASAPPAAEAQLLALLAASGTEDRGKALGAAELADVHRLATELESAAAADQDIGAPSPWSWPRHRWDPCFIMAPSLPGVSRGSLLAAK